MKTFFRFTLRDWIWFCVLSGVLLAWGMDEWSKGANVFYLLTGGESVPAGATLNGDSPPEDK